MIREVVFLPQPHAERMRPLPREGIISITGKGRHRATLRRGWSRVLRLVFDDVERPVKGALSFGEAHACAILLWLDRVEARCDTVFVHCLAGKHRSASVAKFISERYDLSGGIRVYEDHNRRVYRKLWLHWKKRKQALNSGRRSG